MTAEILWDHSHAKPITIHCRHCRGQDVRRDAFAEWDQIAQRWVLSSTFDDGHCEDCGGEAALVERWADTGEAVTDHDKFRGEA